MLTKNLIQKNNLLKMKMILINDKKLMCSVCQFYLCKVRKTKSILNIQRNKRDLLKDTSTMLAINIIMNFIKYNRLYQIILSLIVTYIIKVIPMSIVYAETLIDFLPRQDLDTYNDPFYHPTTFQGAGIPHRNVTNDVIINNEPDGNMTCEDAAYNQRNPSFELTDAHISEELTVKRIHFIDTMVQHSLQILGVAYSENSIEKALIPDGSIKNATFHTLITHGNISEWVTRTETDLKDVTSEANLRLALIQHILDADTKLHPMERKVMCHVLTIMSIINSAEVLHVDINSDKFKNFLEEDYYSMIYNKLTQDEFKHV